MLFYGTIVILLLILILFAVSMFAYRSKSKANALLEQQNHAIKQQAAELEAQKEQLISLSHQLEEATHAKLVFFTNISHEFRTPLTLILGPVETLLQSPKLLPEQRNLLDLVKRNSNSLLGLISQIIEFRSYENGKMRLYLSQTDLRTFLENLNVVFADYAKRRRVFFSFEAEEERDFLFPFDKEKVEKIYYNLLSNAFKHTAADGEIRIALQRERREEGDYARLTVYNKGKQIPKDKINSIFDRFYKVNAHDSGTGIGLALTNALVELHNGSIRVESEADYGTTFTLLLPFAAAEGEWVDEELYQSNYTQGMLVTESTLSDEEELDADRQGGDKPIILLVEDNADMRSYMRLILQEEYHVVEAEDGEEGLKKAIKFVPDIVVSDVMMPGKDGFELCQLLKENVSTSHIPVILLTACSLDEQKAIGFESGADAYIPKPFNAELLKIRVRKLIENRQKIKESFGLSLVSDNKKSSLGEVEQEFVDRFRQYVKLHLSNSDLNQEEIASQMGLSKSQLYRKIKSLTDYSPNELVRVIRLKSARQMLAQQDKSISEVAYDAGFSSLSYFTKCFKEFYKENPTEYINRINESLKEN